MILQRNKYNHDTMDAEKLIQYTNTLHIKEELNKVYAGNYLKEELMRQQEKSQKYFDLSGFN